ncbi:hypothetical protein CDL15_Pgr010895 [Punica granatum]|uniref:Myb/SANT-like domain-containing protein n=1 Tax=Punica granatum TaxID=22663 RepID=A0A218XNJ1_PUNGR|nr:hypothetical protein CDL15_Pgr010895 [Punica granatum]
MYDTKKMRITISKPATAVTPSRSNYKKDVFKNRYMLLRNLYQGIRSLLDQTGFYWDETREIVTTENDVYDEYIKMGDGNVDSLHDITIDEDSTISVPNGVSGPPPNVMMRASKGVRTRTYGEPPMDGYFIDLMLDNVRRGNRVDGVFVKQAWSEMIGSLLDAKFGFGYEVDVLENRYKTLRQQYYVIEGISENWTGSWGMILGRW